MLDTQEYYCLGIMPLLSILQSGSLGHFRYTMLDCDIGRKDCRSHTFPYRNKYLGSIAHAIGHNQLHAGNQIWLREAAPRLFSINEVRADNYAYALLIDEHEAFRLGLTEAWEIAEHFQIPEEMVREQGRLFW